MTAERRATFEVGGPPRVEVRLASGRATFLPGPPGRVEAVVSAGDEEAVEEFRMSQFGDRIALRPNGGLFGRWESYELMVHLPADAEVEASMASAEVLVEAPVRGLKAQLASGDLRVTAVEGKVTVKTASGDVLVGRAEGGLEVTTASGDVRVEVAGGPSGVQTASGDVYVERAQAGLRVRTASGDVRVAHFAGSELACKTVSGNVRVGIPPGRALRLDLSTLSGRISNDFPLQEQGSGEGDVADLSVKTVSGDISLSPPSASPPPPPPSPSTVPD
ncbi:MAG: DUF4097 family beta strand repeat-containing protein [Acidimicrobiia bacterium]